MRRSVLAPQAARSGSRSSSERKPGIGDWLRFPPRRFAPRSRPRESVPVPDLRAGSTEVRPCTIPTVTDFNVVVERDADGYYVASVPALAGCHTQARSLDELMERVREAIELCLEVQGEEPESLDFVGLQRVSVTR